MEFSHPDYHWQLFTADGRDCTADPVYAEEDAHTARLWCESGDLVAEWQRLEPEGEWAQTEPVQHEDAPVGSPLIYPSSLAEITPAALGLDS